MKKLKKNKSLLTKLIAALALSFGFTVVAQTTNTSSNVQTVQAARKLSKRERAAKNWIAMRESGGNYYARMVCVTASTN